MRSENKIPILKKKDITNIIENKRLSESPPFLAMYSSWWGGIVLDPNFMLLPIDEHMVHRGDGVFEAIKALSGGIYLLDEHLDRLNTSANMISLKLPFSLNEIKNIIFSTFTAAQTQEALIRLFVSRGPGDFTANPYSTLGPQLYVIICTLKPYDKEKYVTGVKAIKSQILSKEDLFARIKSCNYLPNVLMKKEALDHGVDFTIGLDRNLNILEGSTENIFYLSAEGNLIAPSLDNILRGTTLIRVMSLAQSLVYSGEIKEIVFKKFQIEELLKAKEVFITGTTIDVLPVVEFEKNKIGTGKPGAVFKKLLELLKKDMAEGSSKLSMSPVFNL